MNEEVALERILSKCLFISQTNKENYKQKAIKHLTKDLIPSFLPAAQQKYHKFIRSSQQILTELGLNSRKTPVRRRPRAENQEIARESPEFSKKTQGNQGNPAKNDEFSKQRPEVVEKSPALRRKCREIDEKSPEFAKKCVENEKCREFGKENGENLGFFAKNCEFEGSLEERLQTIDEKMMKLRGFL